MRGLTNIVWHHDKIESIPSLSLGQFDLIVCTGVLHHMVDPAAGLDILTASLKPGGGMMLMVYPQVFRTAIYQESSVLYENKFNNIFLHKQMQQLMQFINAGVSGRAAELDNLWSLLASLDPQTYIVRATGGPRSAVRGPPGSNIGSL